MLNNLSFHHAKYNKNGFTIVRNLFSKSNIKNLMSELEEIKIKVERTKNNQFFHKTVDGKFNTIHNIQRYHKKGLINDLAKNNFLNNRNSPEPENFFLKALYEHIKHKKSMKGKGMWD